MSIDRRKVLKNIRNYLLGEPNTEWPSVETFRELDDSDPDFRKEWEQDSVIQEWLKNENEKNLKKAALVVLYDKILRGILPLNEKDIELLRKAYNTIPEFREECEKDDTVKESVKNWLNAG